MKPCVNNICIFKKKFKLSDGGPLSCLITDIFMNKLEMYCLESPIAPCNIRFWGRRVDDIICVWHGPETDLHAFLDTLNRYHSTIKTQTRPAALFGRQHQTSGKSKHPPSQIQYTVSPFFRVSQYTPAPTSESKIRDHNILRNPPSRPDVNLQRLKRKSRKLKKSPASMA